MTRFFSLLLAASCLLGAHAQASQLLDGDVFDVYYNDVGTWGDHDASAGLQVTLDGATTDVTWAGTPYQMAAVEYAIGDEAVLDYLVSSGTYTSGSSGEDTNLTVESEEDRSHDDWLLSRYIHTDDQLRIVQLTGFQSAGQAMGVVFVLTNTGGKPISDLRLAFLFDPDQDYSLSTSYETLNALADMDGDGTNDAVSATGASSGISVAITACDQDLTAVGIDSEWYAHYDTDLSLSETDAEGDYGIAAIIKAETELGAGETRVMALVVSAGPSAEKALAIGTDGLDLCDLCDVDGDGVFGDDCEGEDCDDSDASVAPGAAETWYDGLDGDCDGASDYDADGDGADSADYGGEDCDDDDASAYPGAADAWYDGLDSDCDGASDFDADGDSADSADYGGEDCDDDDPAVGPGAAETWYDGLDSDCDGASDYDADGDGVDSDAYGGEDCDDDDAGAYPGAPEINGDGVDQDCDGVDQVRADGGDSGDDSGGDSGDNGGDDGAADTGGAKDGGGCSCSSAPSTGQAWLGLLAAGLLARRRRARL